LAPGDTLVVSKLDRLGRTLSEVVARLATLHDQGVYVKTLDGLLDTASLLVPATHENWFTASLEVQSLAELKARSGVETDLF
jgi:Resolvase, N terminal domain